MKALLSKEYIESFDMKRISKAVLRLFDDYNFKDAVAELYLDSSLSYHYEERLQTVSNYKSDPTESAIIKREELLTYIEKFRNKIDYLKSVFTEEETMIFHFSIEQRETDKVICDRLCKSYKSYLLIKKSCYVKVALRFGLIDEPLGEMLEIISLH